MKLFLVIWLVGRSVSQSVPSEGSPLSTYWQFATAYVEVPSKINNIPGKNQECKFEHKNRGQRLTALQHGLTISSEVMPQDGQDCTYKQILTKESSHKP